jgi:hypothetical protein
MLVVLDLRAERHRIGNDVVLEIDRQVDKAALHGAPLNWPVRDHLIAGIREVGQLLGTDRVEDGLGQELAHALLAEIVEAQAIAGNELRIGHTVIVPAAHDLEAAEQARAFLLGDLAITRV